MYVSEKPLTESFSLFQNDSICFTISKNNILDLTFSHKVDVSQLCSTA